MKPDIQCIGCDRMIHGCMVRPNGKVKCPLFVQIQIGKRDLSAWIALSVFVLGVLEAIFYFAK